MGMTYYPLKILIQDPYDDMFQDIHKRLQAKYQNWDTTQVTITKPDTIEITRDDWIYTLVWTSEEFYLTELTDMAKITMTEKPDQQKIIFSTKVYIEGWSTPDPNMDYFNDYLYIQHVFDDIPNIYIWLDYDIPEEDDEGIRPSNATKSEE